MIALRYIVHDIEASADFYRDFLEFDQESREAGDFAVMTRGEIRLVLTVPGAGAGGSAGGTPSPGGWNRFVLQTDDLDGVAERLRQHGARFRGDIAEGRSGRQLLIEDPAGNPVELFEPRGGTGA